MTMTQKDLEAIDPALSLMAEFSKLSHNTSSHIMKMRQEAIFSDGVISAKVKAMAAALWGISARCEPCLKFYILKAKELGATETEVGEMLAIASAMGGCVGEMWALKAYQALKESSTTEASCCEV
ncbi:TPA: carboxymuconolactone decarboxylase family protein [Legionella pneumophila]